MVHPSPNANNDSSSGMGRQSLQTPEPVSPLVIEAAHCLEALTIMPAGQLPGELEAIGQQGPELVVVIAIDDDVGHAPAGFGQLDQFGEQGPGPLLGQTVRRAGGPAGWR